MIEVLAIVDLEQLKAAGDWKALACHPKIYLKPDVVLTLAKHEESSIRWTLAKNPALAQLPEIALALSKDPNNSVRCNLAANPALAEFPDIALKLAGDLRVVVREAICGNRALKKFTKVVDKASQRTFKYCTVEWEDWEPGRYGSLRHPVKVERHAENCTITFTKGSAHIVTPRGRTFTKRRSTPTWSYIAHRRPTKPPSAKTAAKLAKVELEKLAAAKDRPALASHSYLHLMPEVVLALSHDRDVSVRQALASNPAIANFPDVVLALSQDPSATVRCSLPRKIRLAALRQTEQLGELPNQDNRKGNHND